MVEPAPAWIRASRVAVSDSIRSMKKRAMMSLAFRRAAEPLALGNLASAASGILHHWRVNLVSTITPHLSALGQKQTCATQKVMSALPPLRGSVGMSAKRQRRTFDTQFTSADYGIARARSAPSGTIRAKQLELGPSPIAPYGVAVNLGQLTAKKRLK